MSDFPTPEEYAAACQKLVGVATHDKGDTARIVATFLVSLLSAASQKPSPDLNALTYKLDRGNMRAVLNVMGGYHALHGHWPQKKEEVLAALDALHFEKAA